MSGGVGEAEGAGGEAVNRHFLGWDRPVLHSAADRLLSEVQGTEVADLSPVTVVVPGGRAGRRLVELLLDRCERDGRPLRPPRTVLVGDLPEHLHHPRRPPPGPVAERVAWARAVADTGPDVLRVILPSASTKEDDPALPGLAEAVRSLHAQVGAAGRDFGEVAELCRENAHFSDEPRWRALSRIQLRFREILEEHGWEDRETARRRALDRGAVLAEANIRVIGAPDLPPVTRTFLLRASQEGRVDVLVGAPATIADRFDGLGCVVPEAWAEVEAGVRDASMRMAPDPSGQAAFVLDRVAEVGATRAAEEITLGVPDPEVVPHVVESLGAAGVPTREARGRQIRNTSLWRLLDAVAGFVPSRQFDRFAELVRHPVLQGRLRGVLGTSSPSIVADVDRYRTLHLPMELPAHGRLPGGGERPWEPVQPRIREMREALGGMLEPLESTRPLAEWGGVLAEFIVDLLGDRPVHRHNPADHELLELSRALGRVLEGMEGVPASLDSPIPGHVALRFLLDTVGTDPLPPDPEEGAVELLGWLELSLDDAPVLVVTGMNEPHLPESVTSHPFLPHRMHELLGLLDNPGRRARDLFHLQTILATRPDTLLLAGRRDASGNPLRPSRLLLAEDAGTVARRLLSSLKAPGEEADPDSVDSPPHATEGRESAPGDRGGEAPPEAGPEAAGDGFALPPEPHLSFREVPTKISVTTFRGLLTDPYRFALERVLRLEGASDQLRELDGAGFGDLAHEVLETFGRSEVRHIAELPPVRNALMEILETEARSRFGARPLPAVRIQVEQLRARLVAFAEWQAAWTREGWRMRAVEATPAGGAISFDVDGDPIRLSGKVDRVDVNERTGECLVLDYKTGDKAKSPEQVHRAGRQGEKTWVDLQLPLYLHMASSLLDEKGEQVIPPGRVKQVRAGFLHLSRDTKEVGVDLAEWSAAELDDALEAARRAVRTLRENSFTYDPAGSKFYRDDPLLTVVGGGVLRIEEEEESDDL
jgi:ATP-dependent helicase/nuclease subunit B